MTEADLRAAPEAANGPVSPANELDQALNIGPVTAGWLREVGITSLAELAALGSIEAWRLIKERHPGSVSLVGLYALEGAILGIPWNDLPSDLKAQLRGAARV